MTSRITLPPGPAEEVLLACQVQALAAAGRMPYPIPTGEWGARIRAAYSVLTADDIAPALSGPLFVSWEGCHCTDYVFKASDVPLTCPCHGFPLDKGAPIETTPGVSTNLGHICGEVRG